MRKEPLTRCERLLPCTGCAGVQDQPLAAAVPSVAASSVEVASSLATFDGDAEGTYCAEEGRASVSSWDSLVFSAPPTPTAASTRAPGAAASRSTLARSCVV